MLSLFYSGSHQPLPNLTNEILAEPSPDIPAVSGAEAYNHYYTTLATVESEHLHKNALTVDTRRKTDHNIYRREQQRASVSHNDIL